MREEPEPATAPPPTARRGPGRTQTLGRARRPPWQRPGRRHRLFSVANRTKRTPKKRQVILEAIASGQTVAEAARAAGMARNTIAEWRAADPDFARAFEDSYAAGTDCYEAEARSGSPASWRRSVATSTTRWSSTRRTRSAQISTSSCRTTSAISPSETRTPMHRRRSRVKLQKTPRTRRHDPRGVPFERGAAGRAVSRMVQYHRRGVAAQASWSAAAQTPPPRQVANSSP